MLSPRWQRSVAAGKQIDQTIIMKQSDMNVSPESTIGEIVARNYHAAGGFKQYGLDFCCGGGTSLQKACSEGNISLEDLVADLTAVSVRPPSESENYQAWEPDFLVD